jgi:hypothetical protein
VKQDKDWKKDPLNINLVQLHWELWRQPKLVRLWGRVAAAAKDKMNQAESEKDLAWATGLLKVNRTPGKYGLEKATVDLVKAAAEALPSYQAAVRKYNEARSEKDHADVMVKGLEHKKTSLEEEVKLFLSGYFADPKVANRVKYDEFTKQRALKKVRISN